MELLSSASAALAQLHIQQALGSVADLVVSVVRRCSRPQLITISQVGGLVTLGRRVAGVPPPPRVPRTLTSSRSFLPDPRHQDPADTADTVDTAAVEHEVFFNRQPREAGEEGGEQPGAEAKVVLSVRNPQTWYKSVYDSIYNFHILREDPAACLFGRLTGYMRNMECAHEISLHPPQVVL